MDKLFESLKTFVKAQSVVIDNGVFRLHYRVTAPLLVAFSLLISARQFFGDPIECITRDDIPNQLLDTYCWIHATFSVEEAWMKKVGFEVPYPGVDTYRKQENTAVYHAYYQWVCFMLFLQALFFSLPRYFWRCHESGRVKCLVHNLDSPVMDPELRRTELSKLVNYILASFNNNDYYFMTYAVGEVFNAFNVIFQMFLMDVFLGGAFSTYGAQVIRFTEWDSALRYDPMIRVFPRIAKCTFHRYGSSGDVQKHDSLCILPLNILNEKIYVFLWFWFVILAVASCAAVAYRVIVFVSPEARARCLKPRAGLAQMEHLDVVLRKCKVGDWFLIHLLAKNLDAVSFREFIRDLSVRLEGKDKEDSSEA